jgi:hypothetical protein
MSTAMPKIRGLTVRTLRVPLREPHVTASGIVADSPLVLTDLQCDDGSVGHSPLFTYTPMALKPPSADLVHNLKPPLTWLPAAPPDIEPLRARGLRLLGTPGPDRHGDGRHRHGAAFFGERQFQYLHVLFHVRGPGRRHDM